MLKLVAQLDGPFCMFVLVHTHQIAVLARDSSHNSVVDKVFKQSLKEFHTFLISTYSLSLQVLYNTLLVHKKKYVARNLHWNTVQYVRMYLANNKMMFPFSLLGWQNSVESKEGASSPPAEEPRINLTLSQLVCNFDNIFRGIAKKEGLNDPNHIAIGVNQLRTILDEFGKARYVQHRSLIFSTDA